MKATFIVFTLLLCLPFVFAEPAFVNQSYRTYQDITDGAQFFNITNISITIYEPNGNIFKLNQQAVIYDTGRAYYDYTPNVSGNWVIFATYANATGQVAIGSESVTVIEETFPLSRWTNLEIIAWFFAFLFLLVLAKYLNNVFFVVASGVGFLGQALAILTGYISAPYPTMSFIFFICMSLVSMFLVFENYKQKRQEKED